MAIAVPGCGFRRLGSSCPWLHKTRCCSFSSSSSSHDFSVPTENSQPRPSYFPKRGQTLELVCESLAFKGKGVCKVSDTGFIVMCDRALPGERFLGRIIRKKGNYAELTEPLQLRLHDMIIVLIDVVIGALVGAETGPWTNTKTAPFAAIEVLTILGELLREEHRLASQFSIAQDAGGTKMVNVAYAAQSKGRSRSPP
ncbi:hypothetical protein ACLOJK_014891 [Asimina triloba]